jgi:hypothetical protein
MTKRQEKELLKAIKEMKLTVTELPWPNRVQGMDIDLFRGCCIS